MKHSILAWHRGVDAVLRSLRVSARGVPHNRPHPAASCWCRSAVAFPAWIGALALLLATSGCALIELFGDGDWKVDKDSKLVDTPAKSLQEKKADYEKWISKYEHDSVDYREGIAECDAEIARLSAQKVDPHLEGARRVEIQEQRERRYKIATNLQQCETRLKDLRFWLKDVNQSLAEAQAKDAAKDAAKNAAKDAAKPVVRPVIAKPGC